MQEWLPPAIREMLGSVGAVVGFSVMGRMMHHVLEVQAGRRRFWSLDLIWEIPIAIALGFIGDGFGAWLELPQKPALALIVVMSYLGPRFITSTVISYTKARAVS